MAKYMICNSCVLDTEKNKVIPKDKDNRHYQEYLNWVIEGNIPDPMPEDMRMLYE